VTAARLCPATVRLTPACLELPVTRGPREGKDKVVYSGTMVPRRGPMRWTAMQKANANWRKLPFGSTSSAVSFSFGLQLKGSGFGLEVTNRKERGLVNGRLKGGEAGVPLRPKIEARGL